MKKLKIAWMDPHIYNWANSNYIKTFPFNYELRAFSEVEETLKFLESETNSWVLVTSGRNGENLVSRASEYPNVLGIIIFCMKVKKHKKWAMKYPKVKYVVDRFYKVLDHASEIFNTHANINPSAEMSSLIGLVDPNASIGQMNNSNLHYQIESGLEMSFLKIINLTLKDRNKPRNKRDAVLKEFLALSPSNENEIRHIFNQNTRDLLRSIMYTYTSNLVYNKLNQCYAKNNYESVKNITAATMSELKLRESSLMLRTPTALYRSVVIPDDQLANYEIGQCGFWSGFASTTMNEAVPRQPQFQANVQFEVHLSEKVPHPHIVLPDEWTLYNIEQEVVLLPYFPYKITAIEDFFDFKKITIHQNETHPSLALNSNTLRDYWLNRLENEVSLPFYNLCEQIQHKISVSIDYENYFYIKNPENCSETIFQNDLTGVIYNTCMVLAIEQTHIGRFNDDPSIINCWKILKKDITKNMSKFLWRQIKNIFEPDFLVLKKNLTRVMKEEVVTTFDIPLDLFTNCAQNIFKRAESYLMQEASNLDHNSMQINDEYFEIFCRKVILSMDEALAGQKNDINNMTNDVRRKLNEQLEKLKIKISNMLGEIFV